MRQLINDGVPQQMVEKMKTDTETLKYLLYALIIALLTAIVRESLDKYTWELQQVTNCLLHFTARNSGLNPETLSSLFEDGTQAVIMNLYPPCKQANKVMDLSPDSDATGLTLLVPLNDVQRFIK
ncbi:Isopenicillin N synthase-like [Trema orientale]|uniref:Isopenicillin N synthase-like n=1 Tax=Trema orientale TaxID=63057 RepID=A0A2P5B3L3_TREOI|nr:Isopenicillin N synthase-like [Trema orientale]